MEVSDRPDMGADLNEPMLDEAGQERWSYALMLEPDDGDVVFHYSNSASFGPNRCYLTWYLVVLDRARVCMGGRGSLGSEGDERSLQGVLSLTLVPVTGEHCNTSRLCRRPGRRDRRDRRSSLGGHKAATKEARPRRHRRS